MGAILVCIIIIYLFAELILVNIVTINRMGMAGMAHSGAARAGVKNLSQSLGAEWMEYGIKINNIAPGTVYSPTAQVIHIL